MKPLTKKLLAECEKAGITKIAIGVRHKSVPVSMDHPFINNDVFAYQPAKVRNRTANPPIWKIVDVLKIGFGCGNGDQHQADLRNLDRGVYHYKAGKWTEISV